MFDKAAYISFLLENKVVGFFDSPVKLKSGRSSSFYVNMRKVSEDVYAIDKLSDFVLQFVNDLVKNRELPSHPMTFYGVPEGATKLGIITQYKFATSKGALSPGAFPLAMGRGKRKEHGLPEDRDFLGMPLSPAIVLEDVTTTGGSLIDCIKTLKGSNVDILAAIGLVDRGEKTDAGATVSDAVSNCINSSGAAPRYFSLATAFDVVPEAARLLKPSNQVITAVKDEFKTFGTKEITL